MTVVIAHRNELTKDPGKAQPYSSLLSAVGETSGVPGIVVVLGESAKPQGIYIQSQHGGLKSALIGQSRCPSGQEAVLRSRASPPLRQIGTALGLISYQESLR